MKSRKRRSALKKALFTPLFSMKVVKAKKGKGSWARKKKHRKSEE